MGRRDLLDELEPDTQSLSPASTTLVETSEICTLEADDIVPTHPWGSLIEVVVTVVPA